MADQHFTGQFTGQHQVVGPPRIHRTVRVDFLVRVTTYPLFLLLYGAHLHHYGAPLVVWAMFVWHLLIWPHVAKYHAMHAADSKRAEIRNLLIDSFFIGAAVPLAHFSLWPNATGFLGINAGNVLNGGSKFALRGIGLFILGVLFMSGIAGVNIDFLGASPLVQVLSIAVVCAFTTVFSYFTWKQSQNVLRHGRMIREQAALIEENSSLLAQRSLQLEDAVLSAEAANEAKSNFLANMSHELRTPLNSIIGFGNILLRNTSQNLRTQDVTYLQRITANGAHLLTLINGVLDLSKIDARQMQLDLTSVDVGLLLRETLSEMEPQAEARGVTFVAEIPALALLHTDRSRLKQIVLNLLGNAVKFTENGTVTLRVEADQFNHLPSRIDVIDTGIGIAPERLSAVFEAFQQEDSTTSRQYGGTGLGLTITRSLAHLMGWEISVASEVGIGSTFSVIMIRDSAESLRTTAEQAMAGRNTAAFNALKDAGKFRVLVIDDEFDARTIIKHQLEEIGCDVVTAGSADEGLALARRMRPDLVTLDIMMPRKNGWEALRDLKGHPDLRDIPVVIVSMIARERRGRLLGAVDFIEKPVTRESLADVIRRNVSEETRPSVMLVQDDKTDVHRYRELASKDDISLEVVNGVEEAAAVITTGARIPDLVILDIRRWDNAVSSWVSSLRDDPETVRVRVVVVSNEGGNALKDTKEFGATLLRRDDDLTGDLRAIVSDLRAKGRRRSRPTIASIV